MLETLKALPDEELRAITEQIDMLLKERDRERKEQALEKARAILSQAGLNLHDVAKARAVKPALKAGARYVNPDEVTQSYIVGNGRPPGWFERLRAKGRLPVPVQLQPANDNQKDAGPIKRAGLTSKE
jgi:hypothetical protein